MGPFSPPVSIARPDEEDGLDGRKRFLAQSADDSWRDFASSLVGVAPTWDWVVVTASNERQAEVYGMQIDARLKEGRIPSTCHYLVVPDTGGRRIGSGGATLNAFARIISEIGVEALLSQKVLMIHSGGDSKRIPQYSARGKLFAPVPRTLPDGNRATIFDDLLISVSGVPARIQGGTLVLPSDTEVVFNPLQLDLELSAAAGLSMKAPAAEGAEHGVYLAGEGSKVAAFLHKLPERVLNERGAVDGRGAVDIDTGCIWLGRTVVEKLVALFADDGAVDEVRLALFAGPEACLSLYADFLYPLAADSTFQEYLVQAPESAFTEELDACRRELWDTLSSCNMDLVRLAPSQYVHFGTTWEMRELLTRRVEDLSYLGWERQVGSLCGDDVASVLNNAFVEPGCPVSATAYVEDAVLSDGARVGDGSIVSGVDVRGREIPPGIVFHGMVRRDGRWVCRVYSVEDNPKESSSAPFLGSTIDAVIARAGVSREGIWDCAPASIWNARMYPVRATEEEALDAALTLCRLADGTATDEEARAWAASERESLNSSFNAADVESALLRAAAIEDRIAVARFSFRVGRGDPSAEVVSELGGGSRLAGRLAMLLDEARSSEFPLSTRIYLALSDMARSESLFGLDAQALEDLAYGVVREGIVGGMRAASPIWGRKPRFVKERSTCDLPVRVNFCGSPSDAAPYCLEHGGTMLDAALLLKGKLPIRAVAERIDEPVIVLESLDQGMSGRFSNTDEALSCGDPRDPFALHKACIAAVGVLEGHASLEGFFEHAGGGLRLSTSADVPKGSGLGTSSLIAAACCKALDEAFGTEPLDDLVYDQVFAAEQIMGTCGGWQDQVGGLTPGIKYFTSRPGMHQQIVVERLDLPPRTVEELGRRFALVFSGQRRLARNVLRAETNQLVRNDRGALAAVERIRELAALMRYHLERGDVTAFARLMTEQLSHVKSLDEGATNTCVDYIFEVCDDLIDGKSVCGAGGGGFLQMVLKEGVSVEELTSRIDEEFRGCGVEVWDVSLYFAEKTCEEA